jgi:2,4-dienoyl-CoA reductase-like NADH-dependent reductase (Old Yellow Enzyme family)
MSLDNPFKFRAVRDFEVLLDDIKAYNIDLQYSKDTSLLFEPISFRLNNKSSKTIQLDNRLVIHPMEGCDGNEQGEPSDLTKKRYERFGQSGASIIWYEATAIVPEGRANPRQLIINSKTVHQIKDLIRIADESRKNMLQNNPDLPKDKFEQSIKILQLTHSGRYSRPSKAKDPIRAYRYEDSDIAFGIDPTSGSIIPDKELDDLKTKYLEAIEYAEKAGFDGVDIKSCHRYLISELHSGFTRTNSKYGGISFENRTRFLREIISEAIKLYPKMIITVRLNIYDGLPYPYGFGVKQESKTEPPEFDATEPIKLINALHNMGVNLINFTVGNPYYKPYLSRPYDIPSIGAQFSPEHPLKSIERVVTIERDVKKAISNDILVIGTAFSWFRQWAPFIASGEIKRGSFNLIGFGRMAFANPEFPLQIYRTGFIDYGKSCLTCSKCTDLMRFDSTSGCPIRYPRLYAKVYGDAKRKFDQNIVH